MSADETPPRPSCLGCLRPSALCVCAHLPRLAPRTRVVIVQHPHEADNALGTAHLAARALAGARRVVGVALDDDPRLQDVLAEPPGRALLLWPGPGALDLGAAPRDGGLTLVLVDGTWPQAKKLLRLNPRLAALPRYALPPGSPSEYRIRREPSAECLSTIEAAARALMALEPDPAPYAALLAPFRALVTAHERARDRDRRPRSQVRLRRKRGLPWAPPEALLDPARVVLVAAEANAWPLDAKDRHPDELVHWLAVRGDGSARFEALVRPTHAPAPSVASHTGLSPADLRAGAERGTLRPSFEAFLRPGDVLATWGSFARRLGDGEGLLGSGPVIDLRQVAARWKKGAPGSIEGFVAALGLPAPALGAGRGGRRLGLLLVAYGALRHPGRGAPPRPAPPPPPRG